MSVPVIEAVHLTKCFRLQPDRPRSFQELVLAACRRERLRPSETFWALRDVSFSVEQGETLDIIGSNGSGKSTCLKLLARILEPTSGSLKVNGRISALLELGAGFHPELTGRENVYLQGSVLGIGRKEMARRFDDIVAFSELERFIDVPVKLYSSGMYVRLAFATAINVSADILLVDEVLAVGDHRFQEKCLERIQRFKSEGVTIIYVSHDLDTVRAVCSRALWLDDGELRELGLTESVVMRYLEAENAQDEADVRARHAAQAAAVQPPPAQTGRAAQPEVQAGTDAASAGHEADADSAQGLRFRPGRWGSGEAQVEDVISLDGEGRQTFTLTAGQPATFVIRYRTTRRIEEPVFGLAFFRNDGLHLSGSNTLLADLILPDLQGRGEVRYRMPVMPFLAGSYMLTVAIHNRAETETYDYRSLGFEFRVRLGAVRERYGTVYVPATWEHHPNQTEEAGS